MFFIKKLFVILDFVFMEKVLKKEFVIYLLILTERYEKTLAISRQKSFSLETDAMKKMA